MWKWKHLISNTIVTKNISHLIFLVIFFTNHMGAVLHCATFQFIRGLWSNRKFLLWNGPLQYGKDRAPASLRRKLGIFSVEKPVHIQGCVKKKLCCWNVNRIKWQLFSVFFFFLREEQSLFLINKDKNIISVSLGGNYLKGPVLFDLEFEKRPLPSPAAVIGNVAKLSAWTLTAAHCPCLKPQRIMGHI